MSKMTNIALQEKLQVLNICDPDSIKAVLSYMLSIIFSQQNTIDALKLEQAQIQESNAQLDKRVLNPKGFPLKTV